MKKTIRILFFILALCVLGTATFLTMAWSSSPAALPAGVSAANFSAAKLSPTLAMSLADPRGECTAFCLDNGDHCVFGANQDNTLPTGMLFVNKRNVSKTVWDPNTSGEYGRWISRYGSVTVNFVGYQMVWSGMNEAGLMISTMSVAATQSPIPDERPPFNGPFWMQYQLDNHSTIEQVIASDAEIRLASSAVDHYLVCDRKGACATIEFLEGKLVYHTGASLPVKALTNHTYQESVKVWKESLLAGSQPENNSLWRFTTAANRVKVFEPSTSEVAVNYAFETLKAVSREDTVWSFVYDPINLRAFFRTNHNQSIRYLDLLKLDFSCSTPVRMLDVHADLSGDVSEELAAYSHKASLNHSLSFFTQYEGMSLPPFLVETLLRGVESFACEDGDISKQPDLTLYRPLLPPTVIWGGMAVLYRAWPFWIPLVVLSLALVIWRMSLDQPASVGKRWIWVLMTIILGPFGLLAYLLGQRKKHRLRR